MGDDLLRRRRLRPRLDAVRGLRAVPARGRPPGGPAVRRRGARHVRYLTREGLDWVLKSLFLAAIGEARDQGAGALEAFAYRYSERERCANALHRAPNGLPPRLPRGVRVQHAARPGARRALPARARRPRAGRGRTARPRPAGRAGGLHAAAGRLGAVAVSGALVRLTTSDRKEHRCETPNDCNQYGSGVSRNDHFQWNRCGTPHSGSPAPRRARVGEGSAAHRHEAPVVAASPERQPEDAEGRAVAHHAARSRQQSRIVAPPTGTHDERSDALDRRETLVVVVVAFEDDIRLRAGEKIPERRVRGIGAVDARAEAGVVPVGERARCGVRSEIGPGASATAASRASHPPILLQFEFSTTTCQVPSA